MTVFLYKLVPEKTYKMNNSKFWLLLFLLSSYTFTFAQSNTITQENASLKLAEYYKLERENIHLHLNKNNYLTTENIWFKGYIIEKKIKSPYSVTSNVYISLLDESGTRLDTKLHFSENSTFEGMIQLNETYKTGKYFIQVYTNFMNNFTEDESSFFEINIINPLEENFINDKKINYDSVEISFSPESSIFLEGVSNVLGVKIIDCNNNGILIKDAEIQDSKGALQTTFSTDTNGFGRITIIPAKNEIYTAVLKINDNIIEKKLPIQNETGIVLSANNFGSAGKTLISVKTNNKTNLKNSYSLIINQGEEVSVVPISFKSDEIQKNIAISNESLSLGLNTLTILDNEGKKIVERVIYNPILEKNQLELSTSFVKSDSIIITGKSFHKLGNISISILPNTDYDSPKKSIYNSLLFDNYLNQTVKNLGYYLNEFSRSKHYELDNVLLHQTSKYSINKTLSNVNPTKKYDFDNGITISGTVNNTLYNDDESYSIKINALTLGLSETVKLNKKNEFIFENIIAVDSTSIYFTLIDKKAKSKDLNLVTNLSKNTRKFFKPFIKNSTYCPEKSIEKYDGSDFPKIQGAILLDDVDIKNTIKKDKLSNETRFNNASSRGYKINENVASTFRDVLSFIRSHGYNVTDTGTEIFISRTYTTTFLGSNSPVVYLDDFPIESNNFLRNLNLSTIDEIYINKTGFGAGINGSNGVIRIYTKPVASSLSNIKIKSKSYVIKNAFQPYVPYSNPKFNSIFDESFVKFGTIHWIPNINTDDKGEFKFSIPNLQQKKIKVIIEGITSDGKLLSVVRTLEFN